MKAFLISCLFPLAAMATPAASAPDRLPLSDLPTKVLRGDKPDFQKSKLILVDFWASWCTPCMAALPFYDDLQKKYRDRGVTFISLSEDEDIEDANKFLKKVSFSFPALWDENKKIATQLKLDAIPVLVALAPDGKIISIERGYNEKKKKELPGKIEAWLKDLDPKSRR